jgi:hypothetical protein
MCGHGNTLLFIIDAHVFINMRTSSRIRILNFQTQSDDMCNNVAELWLIHIRISYHRWICNNAIQPGICTHGWVPIGLSLCNRDWMDTDWDDSIMEVHKDARTLCIA